MPESKSLFHQDGVLLLLACTTRRVTCNGGGLALYFAYMFHCLQGTFAPVTFHLLQLRANDHMLEGMIGPLMSDIFCSSTAYKQDPQSNPAANATNLPKVDTNT
jgi:hypothetical protein